MSLIILVLVVCLLVFAGCRAEFSLASGEVFAAGETQHSHMVPLNGLLVCFRSILVESVKFGEA